MASGGTSRPTRRWRRRRGRQPILLEDGDILSLAPGPAEVVDSAPVGRLVLDGSRLVPLQGAVMGARRRMLFNGVAIASLAVDEAGRLRGAAADQRARPVRAGRSRERPHRAASWRRRWATCRRRCGARTRRSTDAAAAALRRALGRRLQKRPLVDVHLLRV